MVGYEEGSRYVFYMATEERAIGWSIGYVGTSTSEWMDGINGGFLRIVAVACVRSTRHDSCGCFAGGGGAGGLFF
jgi:hypothetical protein